MEPISKILSLFHRRLFGGARRGRACLKQHGDPISPLSPGHVPLPAAYAPYRDRIPYIVADDLDALQGPTSGPVTLPVCLNWSGSPHYDLDDPDVRELRGMYKTIIMEAGKQEDLLWLNRDRLIAEWPYLNLPERTQHLWEEKYPWLSNLKEN